MRWHERSRLNWRAALRLRPCLQAAREARHHVDLPAVHWSSVSRTFGRARESHRRLWSSAARHADEEAARGLAEFLAALDRARAALRRRQDDLALTTTPELWHDLEAIHEEFEEAETDLKAKEVRVVIGPVVLDGIDLGRFRIVLDWLAVGQRHPYWVEALDPCPAESNEELVHPHVNDGILCEGDGQHAIRQALEHGRLLDFFVLVRQVLCSYNSDSAYLRLDRWQGSPCQGCGSLADADETCTCDSCRDQFCGDCTRGCSSCLDCTCDGCCRPCRHCDQCYCPSCMITCSQCDSEGCDSCLKEGRCPDCLNPETEEEEPEHDDCNEGAGEAAAVGAAFHALCLGEIDVPA